MMIDESTKQHLRRTWNFNEFHCESLDFPFLQGIVDDLCVVRVAPLIPARGVWVYVTVGAWQIPTNPDRREFIIVSPLPDDSHLATLAELVFRHAVPSHAFKLGDSYDLGRPWLNESESSHSLVSRPYILDPAIEFAERDGMPVRYLWLMPITSSERAFLKSNGIEALERAFEVNAIQPLDTLRKSVV